MALYNNAIEQAKAESKTISVKVVRLATVTSLTANGKPKVTFFGDTAESSKEYSYLEGYIPEVGDVVAMIPQADTWIILGHVASDSPAEAAPFVQKGGGSIDKLVNGSRNVALTTSTLEPDTTNVIDLGSDSKRFKTAHVNELYINGTKVTDTATNKLKSGDNTVTLSSKELVPNGYNFVLGTTQYPFEMVTTKITLKSSSSSPHTRTFTASEILATGLESTGMSGSSYGKVYFDSATVLRPNLSNTVSLGTSSYQFNNIYGKQIYQNGSSVTTSDRRKKKSIKSVAKKYIDFFKALRPVTFKYRDGESGRTHAGFIAQEVEEAMKSCGIDNADFAGLVIQEDGSYGLRYEEFIALQTKVIQNLLERVDTLERRLTDGQ